MGSTEKKFLRRSSWSMGPGEKKRENEKNEPGMEPIKCCDSGQSQGGVEEKNRLGTKDRSKSHTISLGGKKKGKTRSNLLRGGKDGSQQEMETTRKLREGQKCNRTPLVLERGRLKKCKQNKKE